MNDPQQPLSSFDEICHLMVKTMLRMDMQTLWNLKKQATRELDRAKLAKGCVELALSLKQQEEDRAAEAEDANQPSLLDIN